MARQPPRDFIRYTCGTDDVAEFHRSGLEVYTMFNLAALRYAGRGLYDFKSILDFGCGAGRIMQFLPSGPAVYGCDVNPLLAAYTGKTFPTATIHANAFAPPLAYADELFDLVYAFSVFSHLPEELEQEWLRELSRVGAPGCTYLITIHGDWMIEATLGPERRAAEEAGFYFRNVHQRSGSDLDFPDGYEASYHTSEYIHRAWSPHLEVLAILKGDDPSRYLFGEHRFAPAGRVHPFRPMGQDLVVLRKRVQGRSALP